MTELDLEKAVRLLENGSYTCVLCGGDAVYSSELHGVKPLLDWNESGTNLKGFSAADKVVGKAAAYLYVLLGIKAVYAQIISEDAVAAFEQYGVEVSWKEKVKAIRNRMNTGLCPMEQAVKDITVPEEALKAIQAVVVAGLQSNKMAEIKSEPK